MLLRILGTELFEVRTSLPEPIETNFFCYNSSAKLSGLSRFEPSVDPYLLQQLHLQCIKKLCSFLDNFSVQLVFFKWEASLPFYKFLQCSGNPKKELLVIQRWVWFENIWLIFCTIVSTYIINEDFWHFTEVPNCAKWKNVVSYLIINHKTPSIFSTVFSISNFPHFSR